MASGLQALARMRSFSHAIHSAFLHIRVCANCGSFLGAIAPSAEQLPNLCRTCTKPLQLTQLKDWVLGYQQKTLSLYEWRDENEYLSRKMALSLKGGGPRELFHPFAERLCLLRLNLGHRHKQRPVFVPAPGRSGAKLDHAESLALALSEIAGGEYFSALKRIDLSEQKNKSDSERRLPLPRFLLKEDAFEPLGRFLHESSPLIFVDDIITTGSTAQLAYEALKRPNLFEIWTIFHRPRLRC